MKRRLRTVWSPIIGVAILTLGNGFFVTLSSLQIKQSGYSTFIVGVVAAAYFVGLLVGAWCSQKLIMRVGHIRAYCVFASLIAMSSLLQGVFVSPWIWIVLRFICGYGLAALFIIIEGWIMARGTPKSRGRMLGIYLFVYYIAQALGQWLLNLPYQNELQAFCLVSVLASLSILPMCMTRFRAPSPHQPEAAAPWQFFNLAPLGLVGGLVAGLLLGVIYAVLPVFFNSLDLGRAAVANLMLITILGGALLQLPIGKLSDIVDRRKLIFFIALALVILSLLLVAFVNDYWALMGLSFLLGGFSFALYPVCISHVSDYVKQNKMVSAIGAITLVYGLGSALGPLIVPLFMSLLTASGLFIYFVVVCAALAIYTFWRLRQRPTQHHDDKGDFVNTVPVTAVSNEAQLMDEHASC